MSIPNTLEGLYSNLNNYSKQVSEFISAAKTTKKDEYQASPLDGIFKDIDGINHLDARNAQISQLASQHIAGAGVKQESRPWDEKSLQQLNKNLKEAKKQELVQGKTGFKKLGAILTYYFTRSEKLGIKLIDVPHFLSLVANAKKPEAKPVPVVREPVVLQQTNVNQEQAYKIVNDVCVKLGPAAQGTYLLTDDGHGKASLYLVEKNNNIVKYSFVKQKEGGYKVSPSDVTCSSPAAFVTQRQIALAKEDLANAKVNDYAKIETGRTEEGIQYTVLIKTANGVDEKHYVEPNRIKVGDKTYESKEALLASWAKEKGVTLVEIEKYSGQAEAVADTPAALEFLKGKAPGTWIEVTPAQGGSRHSLHMVVKNPQGQPALAEIQYERLSTPSPLDALFPKKSVEFVSAGVRTINTIPEMGSLQSVFKPVSVEARQKQIETIQRLDQFVTSGTQEQLWNFIRPVTNYVPNPNYETDTDKRVDLPDSDSRTKESVLGDSPFVLQKAPGALPNQFTLVADPSEKKPVSGNFFDRATEQFTVLEGGQIKYSSRVFASFDAFAKAQKLASYLPVAILTNGKWNQTSKDQVSIEKQLMAQPGDCSQFWVSDRALGNQCLSIKQGGQVTTYTCSGMSIGSDGKAVVQFSAPNKPILPISVDSLNKSQKPENIPTLLQTFKAQEQLKGLAVGGEIVAPKDLVPHNGDKGYFLKAEQGGFVLKEYSAGLFTTSETISTITILPNGSIQKQTGAEKVVLPLSEFIESLEAQKSLKQLDHMRKFGEAEKKQIDAQIQTIKAAHQNVWCESKKEAQKLIATAKSFDIEPGSAVMYREGVTNTLVLLSHVGGEIKQDTLTVLPDGKVVVGGKEYTNLSSANVKFADLMKKGIEERNTYADDMTRDQAYHAGSLKDNLAAFQAHKDSKRFTAEQLAGAHSYSVETRDGAKHLYLTYCDKQGEIKQVEINSKTDLTPYGIDSNKTLTKLAEQSEGILKQIKTAGNRLRAHEGFDKNQVTQNDLEASVQSLAKFFENDDQITGTWAACELLEKGSGIVGGLWGLIAGATKETDQFVISVCRGTSEDGDEVLMKSYTITVNPNGQFIVDGKNEQPIADLSTVLAQVGATKPFTALAADKAKCEACEKQILEDRGFFAEGQSDEVEAILRQSKEAYSLSPTGASGSYTLKGNGNEVEFSTRTKPGFFVVADRNKEYQSLGLLIGAEAEFGAVVAKPWKQLKDELAAAKAREEAERAQAAPKPLFTAPPTPPLSRVDTPPPPSAKAEVALPNLIGISLSNEKQQVGRRLTTAYDQIKGRVNDLSQDQALKLLKEILAPNKASEFSGPIPSRMNEIEKWTNKQMDNMQQKQVKLDFLNALKVKAGI